MQYMYMVKTQAEQKSQKVEISLHTSLTRLSSSFQRLSPLTAFYTFL